jgi:hypothetical protein
MFNLINVKMQAQRQFNSKETAIQGENTQENRIS